MVSGAYGIVGYDQTVQTPKLYQPTPDEYQPITVVAGNYKRFGPIAAGQILYQLTPHFGLGLEYRDWNWHDSASLRHEFYLAKARYVFMPERDWNPYVFGGAGIDRVYGSALGFIAPWPWAPFAYEEYGVSVHKQLFAGTAGLGIERSITANLFSGVELGIMYIPPINDPDLIVTREVLPFLTARLGFDFGGFGRQ